MQSDWREGRGERLQMSASSERGGGERRSLSWPLAPAPYFPFSFYNVSYATFAAAAASAAGGTKAAEDIPPAGRRKQRIGCSSCLHPLFLRFFSFCRLDTGENSCRHVMNVCLQLFFIAQGKETAKTSRLLTVISLKMESELPLPAFSEGKLKCGGN